jgi:hypothetical protein
LEKPKIAPHIPQMRKAISEVMNLEEGRISIKATTNEKMGFIGREEGIVSYAVALIKKEFTIFIFVHFALITINLISLRKILLILKRKLIIWKF